MHVKQRRVPHTHKQSQELNSEEATGYDRSKVVIWDKKRLSFNRKSYSPSTFYLWVTPVAMKTSRMDIDTWGIFTCQYSLRSRAGKRSHTVHPVWKKSHFKCAYLCKVTWSLCEHYRLLQNQNYLRCEFHRIPQSFLLKSQHKHFAFIQPSEASESLQVTPVNLL